MAEKKRYYVGLMIHHLENEYSTEVLKGAITAAEELDINLILLPGRGINAIEDEEKYSIYDYQYNVIYDYVSVKNLDALIVSAGTIGSYISQKEMEQFLRGYRPLPILTMEVEYPGYPCIHFNTNSMKLAVEHLIHSCGCTKIGFVSGPIGNADAMDRLRCYRSALEENAIPYDPNKIVYGNFSEASENVVEMLLDANPDLEAICFANDKMCIGGYHVFQNRGLRVGKDILVTGFDDSDVATSLKPMLTTIRTNVSDMGYRAVCAAYEMIKTGHTESQALDARLIIRDSCRNEKNRKISPEVLRQMALEHRSDEIVYHIFNKYIGDVESKIKTDFMRQIHKLIRSLFDDLCFRKPLHVSVYEQRIDEIFSQTDEIRIQIPALKKILHYAKVVSGYLCENSLETQLAVEKIYSALEDRILDYSIQQQYILRTNLVYSNFLISNINKDMMLNCNDEEKSFFSIVNNLYRVNFKSSYIYTFRVPIVHYQYDKWLVPRNLYLKSYHIGKDLERIEPADQQIPVFDCIHNPYTPNNRRFTFVLVPLFSNEEQYGLFVCELDPNHFSQIYSVAPQICSAIKLTRLVKELEGNLEEARYDNRRLEQISDSDELTGAYNRRGFYRYANLLLESPESTGKTGVLVLGDLDNLKVINDTFGHDEGDHALKTCIRYLRSSTPNLNVIGRIGGDEFAAFAIVDNTETALHDIYNSIKEAAVKYNEESDKPYRITISLGIRAIVCGAGKRLQSYVKFADASLYEDKKKKNRVVIKPGRNPIV